MSNSSETPVGPGLMTPEELLQLLRAARARTPMPEPAQVPEVLSHRLTRVDPNFVRAAVAATNEADIFEKAVGRADGQLHGETDVITRWAAVIDEMRTYLQSLTAANTIRRQRLGLAALQIYQFCKQLARTEEGRLRFGAYLAEMKRHNRFNRGRRKATRPPVPENAGDVKQ